MLGGGKFNAFRGRSEPPYVGCYNLELGADFYAVEAVVTVGCRWIDDR